jgi:hypothetical protein
MFPNQKFSTRTATYWYIFRKNKKKPYDASGTTKSSFAEFWQGKGDEKQEIQREIVAELFKLYQQAVEK